MTPAQSDYMYILAMMGLVAATAAVIVWAARAAVRRWGAGHVAAGTTGVMLAASLVAVALYRLLTWPLRAHRRGMARLAAADQRTTVTR